MIVYVFILNFFYVIFILLYCGRFCLLKKCYYIWLNIFLELKKSLVINEYEIFIIWIKNWWMEIKCKFK